MPTTQTGLEPARATSSSVPTGIPGQKRRTANIDTSPRGHQERESKSGVDKLILDEVSTLDGINLRNPLHVSEQVGPYRDPRPRRLRRSEACGRTR